MSDRAASASRIQRIKNRLTEARDNNAPYDSHALEDIEWLIDQIEGAWEPTCRCGTPMVEADHPYRWVCPTIARGHEYVTATGETRTLFVGPTIAKKSQT